MGELLIALLPIVLVAGLALLAIFIPLKALAASSLALMALGLVAGVPSGLLYHVLLRRELLQQGALPSDWYWHPQRYHAGLGRVASARLRPWFLAGALGFLMIVLGFVLAVTTLALWFRGDPTAVLL